MFRRKSLKIASALSGGALIAATFFATPAWAEHADRNLCDAPAANTVVSTIDNIKDPVGIVADHIRGLVYVANFSTPTVSVIDEATKTLVTTIPVGNHPYAMAIDTYHGKVYVTNYLGGSVSVIDEETNTVTATVTGMGNAEHGIAVDPVRGKIYVVSVVNSHLWVIDQATNTVTNSLALPISAGGVEVDPIRGTIYASINPGVTNSSVDVIDPDSLTVTATVPLTTPNAEWMAIDPIGHKLYVAGATIAEGVLGAVFVVDTATNTLTNTIPAIQNDTIAIAFDPLSRTVYATSVDYNSSTGGVMVIDAVTNTLTDTIPLNNAFGLAFDFARRSLFVSVPNANEVEAISAGTPRSWHDRDRWADDHR